LSPLITPEQGEKKSILPGFYYFWSRFFSPTRLIALIFFRYFYPWQEFQPAGMTNRRGMYRKNFPGWVKKLLLMHTFVIYDGKIPLSKQPDDFVCCGSVFQLP
jgi:hypothetical protein